MEVDAAATEATVGEPVSTLEENWGRSKVPELAGTSMTGLDAEGGRLKVSATTLEDPAT